MDSPPLILQRTEENSSLVANVHPAGWVNHGPLACYNLVVFGAGADGLGLFTIGQTIHPYPTQAEPLKKLADNWNRSRLTPLVKKTLEIWLKWQRN
jgi:hypothetical protein